MNNQEQIRPKWNNSSHLLQCVVESLLFNFNRRHFPSFSVITNASIDKKYQEWAEPGKNGVLKALCIQVSDLVV